MDSMNRTSAADSAQGFEVDTESGATDWAHAFAAQDPGTGPAPPAAPPPGRAPKRRDIVCAAPVAGDAAARATDAATGATPGVASACRDLGMQSVERVARERGIKPPGIV